MIFFSIVLFDLFPLPSSFHQYIFYYILLHQPVCSKTQFLAEFMINLSIQKFIPSCPHLPPPLKIEEYQRKGGLKPSRTNSL